MLRTAAIALRRVVATAASRPSVVVRPISSVPVFSMRSDLWTGPAVRPVLCNLDLPRRYARESGRESYPNDDVELDDDSYEFDDDDDDVEDESEECSFSDREFGDSEGNFSEESD